MRAMKPIIVIVLLMVVFTMFIVPMEEGNFPAWLDADLIGFMLIVFCVILVLALMH